MPFSYISSHKLPAAYADLSDQEIHQRTVAAKQAISNRAVILAHNYQRDEIVEFADFVGDSLELARRSLELQHKIIVFAGVHFMAESTDILNQGKKIVTLPSLEAGCALADMATLDAVVKAWTKLKSTHPNLVPVTYINSTAEIKAFCGDNAGLTCTSSNARDIIARLLSEGKQVLFLPDQNLGTNSGLQLGLSADDIAAWDWINGELEGNDSASLLVWKGFCPVHTPFSTTDINRIRQTNPDIQIVVHPECLPEVAKQADFVGSTAQISDYVAKASPGSRIAIGTEVNLVNRLNDQYPEKHVQLLKAFSCACNTMSRISPEYLLWNLEGIARGKIINRITVPKKIAKSAYLALERMLKF